MRTRDDIDMADAGALARHGLGFARMSADGTLLARAGAALEWLPEIGGDCLATPLLFGMGDELAALRAGARDIVALPSLGLDSGEKISLTLAWDETQDCFSLVAARAFGARETETMLVRERRERRLADEQAEAARRRANISDALYRDIVESSSDLVLRIAADGTISFANIHAQAFCGRRLERLVGARLEHMLPPLDGDAWGALAQRASEETFEQKLAAADGRAAWILWRVTWLGDAEGPPEFQAVGRDITRLRILQAEVERARAHGIKILGKGHPDYPALLGALPNAPILLYVRGAIDPHGPGRFPVAIVGSRHCTTYGLEQAERFGSILAQSGLMIVSGGARGIDTAAHRGALPQRVELGRGREDGPQAHLEGHPLAGVAGELHRVPLGLEAVLADRDDDGSVGRAVDPERSVGRDGHGHVLVADAGGHGRRHIDRIAIQRRVRSDAVVTARARVAGRSGDGLPARGGGAARPALEPARFHTVQSLADPDRAVRDRLAESLPGAARRCLGGGIRSKLYRVGRCQ